MLSTIEKLLFLKEIELFQSLSHEDLAQVAQIAIEVEIEENETFIVEGDIGDALFLILEGRVSIHKGNQVLTTLGEKEPIGEMGILDSSPRSASCSAVSDLRVLKIERDDFHELMADRLEIAQGIIKVLLSRLRRLSAKSVGQKQSGEMPAIKLQPPTSKESVNSPPPTTSSEPGQEAASSSAEERKSRFTRVTATYSSNPPTDSQRRGDETKN